MRVPVLTYHAVNIAGNDYANNDHVAFASDLRLIDEMGLRIVPASWLVDELTGSTKRDLGNAVVLTCDDGSHFDYFDLDHPTHGPQRSLHNAMTDFIYERGVAAQPDLHLTCFVIASPEAREHIDRECLVGSGWMSERWWKPALQSGRIGIENHSFDHNHSAIPLPGIDGMERGSFFPVNTRERADAEIAAAARYIDAANRAESDDALLLSVRPVERLSARGIFPAHGRLARHARRIRRWCAADDDAQRSLERAALHLRLALAFAGRTARDPA